MRVPFVFIYLTLAIKHPLVQWWVKKQCFHEYLDSNVDMKHFRAQNVIQHGPKPLG